MDELPTTLILPAGLKAKDVVGLALIGIAACRGKGNTQMLPTPLGLPKPVDFIRLPDPNTLAGTISPLVHLLEICPSCNGGPQQRDKKLKPIQAWAISILQLTAKEEGFEVEVKFETTPHTGISFGDLMKALGFQAFEMTLDDLTETDEEEDEDDQNAHDPG